MLWLIKCDIAFTWKYGSLISCQNFQEEKTWYFKCKASLTGWQLIQTRSYLLRVIFHDGQHSVWVRVCGDTTPRPPCSLWTVCDEPLYCQQNKYHLYVISIYGSSSCSCISCNRKYLPTACISVIFLYYFQIILRNIQYWLVSGFMYLNHCLYNYNMIVLMRNGMQSQKQ